MPEVTVANAEYWHAHPEQLAGLLRHAPPGGVVPSPSGPADPAGLVGLTDPQFWADDIAHLRDALADLVDTAAPSRAMPAPGRAAGAAPTTAAGRLTLTVEEAAGILGISRAFAYEAVRRGEIPSIRIGRRVLVPRVALDRLVNGSGAGAIPEEG